MGCGGEYEDEEEKQKRVYLCLSAAGDDVSSCKERLYRLTLLINREVYFSVRNILFEEAIERERKLFQEASVTT